MWAIRARLQRERSTRELALFNLVIDSKLRGCDLVALKVRDVQHGAQIAPRAIITQHKTGRPVQFEITPPTRASVQAWVVEAGLKSEDYLFPHCSQACRAVGAGLRCLLSRGAYRRFLQAPLPRCPRSRRSTCAFDPQRM